MKLRDIAIWAWVIVALVVAVATWAFFLWHIRLIAGPFIVLTTLVLLITHRFVKPRKEKDNAPVQREEAPRHRDRPKRRAGGGVGNRKG